MSELTIKDKVNEVLRENFKETIERAVEQHGERIVEFAERSKVIRQQSTDEIMQLIDSAITEARLDELDRIASPSNKASVHPNAGFDYFIGWGVSEIYVKDRIAQLKDNTSV